MSAILLDFNCNVKSFKENFNANFHNPQIGRCELDCESDCSAVVAQNERGQLRILSYSEISLCQISLPDGNRV